MHDKTTLGDKLVAAARATYENVTVVTVVGCVVALIVPIVFIGIVTAPLRDWEEKK